MINDKDIKLKEIKDKKCIAFVYDLFFDDGNGMMRCFYHHVENRVKKNIWQVEVWDYSTSNKSDVIYRWTYEMPKSDMPLTMVCAFGLMRLQMQLKEEIQTKSELDFTIGEMLEGVHG